MKVLLVGSPGGHLGQLHRLPASAATTAPKSASPPWLGNQPSPRWHEYTAGTDPGFEYEMEPPGAARRASASANWGG